MQTRTIVACLAVILGCLACRAAKPRTLRTADARLEGVRKSFSKAEEKQYRAVLRQLSLQAAGGDVVLAHRLAGPSLLDGSPLAPGAFSFRSKKDHRSRTLSRAAAPANSALVGRLIELKALCAAAADRLPEACLGVRDRTLPPLSNR
jgi:hypothetical protein